MQSVPLTNVVNQTGIWVKLVYKLDRGNLCLRTFCSLRFTTFGYTNDVISFFFSFLVLSGIRKRQEGNGSVSSKGTHPHRAFVGHLIFLSSKNCNSSTVGSAYSYKNLTVGLKKCVQIPHPCRGLRYLRLRTFCLLRFTVFGYTYVSFLSFFFSSFRDQKKTRR